MTPDLRQRRVFIAASFPSGERGVPFAPFDPNEIADAVTAVARAVFNADGGLVFGGHPTITPLILLVAAEHGRQGAVDIYQSRWFAHEIPEETRRFEQMGVGRITWTPRRPSESASLALMRAEMLSKADPLAALFVGGMAGIEKEWQAFGDRYPERLRLPIAAPGGAAARLVDRAPVPDELRPFIASARYPVVAHRLVEYLARIDAHR